MVAIINLTRSAKRVVMYNENKVKVKSAVLIGARYFLKDYTKLNLNQKLLRFTNRNMLNDRANLKMVHITLNFAPTDKLTTKELYTIASLYVDRIGLAKQPFLLYEHLDSAHQHVHIVSTRIKSSGKCLNMHNVGKIQSELSRREIEVKFNLTKADTYKRMEYTEEKSISKKAQYGKISSMKSISIVLDYVVKEYNYTTFDEYNAVLKQYNVLANLRRSRPGAGQQRGISYHILDDQGNKIGVPIKASAFRIKPTSKVLSQYFLENQHNSRDQKLLKLKTAVELHLRGRNFDSFNQLKEDLKQQGIVIETRPDSNGIISRLIYVDLINKAAFDQRSFGEEYSALGIAERFSKTVRQSQINTFYGSLISSSIKENKNDVEDVSQQKIILDFFHRIEQEIETPNELSGRKIAIQSPRKKLF